MDALKIAQRFSAGNREPLWKQSPGGTEEALLPSLAGLCPSRAIPPSTEVLGYCRLNTPHFDN